ncbi:MAG: hypothetical protein E6K49_03810 [Gammaproteobacteria bacterium]|nr:MAG: hypothetical protein E6K49_03810 [Gammaproteobacteria bacterium]
MLCKLLPLAIAVAWSAAALATDVAPRAPDKVPDKPSGNVVFLDGPALAELQSTNPNHYARAKRILAAANYLCRPRVPQPYLASFAAQELSCAGLLLRTSNPPKWQIGFRLDDTRYIAWVIISDDPPRAVPAR